MVSPQKIRLTDAEKAIYKFTADLSPRELKKQAARFLDMKELFPKSNPKLNRTLTNYQVKKIRSALREVAKIADGVGIMQRDFVPLKKAKKYAADNNLPTFLKGVFMAGGERDNKNAVYENNRITYTRGNTRREYISLNNWSARILETELRAALKTLPRGGLKGLSANGRLIAHPPTQTSENELIVRTALEQFNKYKDMAARGETRANGNIAAHPKKWGIGLLWQPANADKKFEALKKKEAKNKKAKNKK